VNHALLCRVTTGATEVPLINPILISFKLFSFPFQHSSPPPFSALVCMNVGSDNHDALGDGWHILHRTGYECRSRQRRESFEHCCSHCPSGFCVLPKHICIYIFFFFGQVLPHKLISCFYVMITCILILCSAQIKVDKVIMCCITETFSHVGYVLLISSGVITHDKKFLKWLNSRPVARYTV